MEIPVHTALWGLRFRVEGLGYKEIPVHKAGLDLRISGGGVEL